MKPVGGRLAQLRQARRLSMGDVAQLVGVSKPTVWAWEHGKCGVRLEHVDKLLNALRCTGQELFDAGPDPLANARELVASHYGVEPWRVRISIDV